MHFYTNERTVDDYSVIGIKRFYKNEINRKFRKICAIKSLILICLLVSTTGNIIVFRQNVEILFLFLMSHYLYIFYILFVYVNCCVTSLARLYSYCDVKLYVQRCVIIDNKDD